MGGPRQNALAAVFTASLLLPALAHGSESSCKGTLYLTLDTGNMRHAEVIAGILAKHHVKATFFVAQEKTLRGDMALDQSWSDYWKARVAEGHAFGSHTWRHGSFRKDEAGGKVTYRLMDGSQRVLDAEQVCTELKKPDLRFAELTGRRLDRRERRAALSCRPVTADPEPVLIGDSDDRPRLGRGCVRRELRSRR